MHIALSYRPMLNGMDALLFGEPATVFGRHKTGEESHGEERHIDRRLNVQASGNQHTSYFNDLVDQVIHRFNQQPLEAQPQAIVDVGCGDGSLLKQVYHAIADHTLRGQHLDQFPSNFMLTSCCRPASSILPSIGVGLAFWDV